MVTGQGTILALAALSGATLLSCIDDGAAIEAKPQQISFSAVPAVARGQASVTVSAESTSGLPIRYSSLTPLVCSADNASGHVTAFASGTCTIAANQGGNDDFAAAPQVTQDLIFSFPTALLFASAPSLRPYDLATVTAVDGAGLPVTYATTTSEICSIDGATGLVTALSAGTCDVRATSEARSADLAFVVSSPSEATAPEAPTNVTATAGDRAGSVVVRVGALAAGGSPVLGYTVQSNPLGVYATGTALPLKVTCPSSCAGFSFSVSATNALGTGPASEFADVLTGYDVVETFYEPDTQPNNSLFVGTFTFDATTSSVAALRGRLSESMTGGTTAYPNDTMTWLSLDYELSSLPVTIDGESGVLVTTFLLNTTHTLSADPTFGGTDGWTPGTGLGLYYGYPGANSSNAYARILVKVADPTAALTQAQIDRLAYADCTAGGLMGATCMTGTTLAGYGSVGTMSGFPTSQVVTEH